MTAIFGLGRSGLAAAKAVLALGGTPHIFDQKAEGELAKPEPLAEARVLGIPCTLGWDGALPDCQTLVVNPAVDQRSPILREARNRGIEVIGEIELAYRIAKAPIVAVTGTNGKSTTAVMVWTCLKACGEFPRLCGNIYGSGYPEAPLTEAALAAGPDEVLVAEISSFQLEQVSTFAPVSAGITNITPEHLNRYDSFEDYAAAKQRIFAAQTDRHFAVVRAGDPVVAAPGRPAPGYRPRHARTTPPPPQGFPRLLTFGAAGEEAEVQEDRIRILDKWLRREETRLEGVNLTNGAMAALLAYGYLRWRASQDPQGRAAALLRQDNEPTSPLAPRRPPIERVPKEILQGLRDFRPLANRMEVLGEKGGVRVVNNSMCTNPEALLGSLQSVKDPVHVLVGGKKKVGLDWRPVRNYLANRRHTVYLYGADRAELQQDVGGIGRVHETLAQAFADAVTQARPQQVILLAPACESFDQFKDFRERGDVFRKIAMEWLEG